MLDFGFDKLALIGAVALVVIGPERLPRVARTVGALLGKAQRYVADVKAEVNRSIELEELNKVKGQFEEAARNVERTIHEEVNATAQAFNPNWQGERADGGDKAALDYADDGSHLNFQPQYKRPQKNWRLKRGATPRWYKNAQGVRQHVQSGAARVARFRPTRQSPP